MLLNVLKKKCIWALNLGENYEISPAMWDEFTEELRKTNVTHLYVSEHVINTKLKIRMRDVIRYMEINAFYHQAELCAKQLLSIN